MIIRLSRCCAEQVTTDELSEEGFRLGQEWARSLQRKTEWSQVLTEYREPQKSIVRLRGLLDSSGYWWNYLGMYSCAIDSIENMQDGKARVVLDDAFRLCIHLYAHLVSKDARLIDEEGKEIILKDEDEDEGEHEE